MTGRRFGRRTHPRAGRRLVGLPAGGDVVPFDGPRDDLVPAPAPETQPLPAVVVDDDPLPASAVERLERLTDIWTRQARIAGSGADATMFYAAPPKPPPPSPAATIAVAAAAVGAPLAGDQLPVPVPELSPANSEQGSDRLELHPAAVPGEQSRPRVVRDWSSRHDPRSLEYDVRSRLAARVPLQERVWETGPVFDQGSTPPLTLRDASGCVGMAVAAAANVLELAAWQAPTGAVLPGPDDGLLTKDDALALYDRAQDLDHVSATRVGGAGGTSVLAGMLAGREAGLWPGFLWAFGTRDVAQAVLQVGPVVIGIPWDGQLDDPDPAGIVTPGGAAAGGHALAVVGLVRRTPAGGPSDWYFVLQQSRGEAHGDRGRVYVHHRQLQTLLAGVGEAAVPLPHWPTGALR